MEPARGWVISKHPAHAAPVSEADFIAAQDAAAPRGPAGPALIAANIRKIRAWRALTATASAATAQRARRRRASLRDYLPDG